MSVLDNQKKQGYLDKYYEWYIFLKIYGNGPKGPYLKIV